MHGLAKEQLIAGVLKKLEGSFVDESSHEYNLLITHQTAGQCGFVATWLEQDEAIFGLVPVDQYQIDDLQEAIETGNENLFECDIEGAIDKVLNWNLRITRKETESAKEYLTVSILYWIFNSHVVTEQMHPELRTSDLMAETENSFVFGFTNTNGYETNVVIVFDDDFLSMVQASMNEKNYDLFARYLDRIKDHIVMLCTAQAEHAETHWTLYCEIFKPPRL